MEILVRNPGKLVSQRQLLQEVWGPQYQDETNYLRVYMAQIRRKLEPDPARPRYFITEPGMGYRFEPKESIRWTIRSARSSRGRACAVARVRAGDGRDAALVAAFLPFRDDITPLNDGVRVPGAGRRDGRGRRARRPGSWRRSSAFLAFNFFFIPPYDTFAIGEGDDVVVLFVFLGLVGPDLRAHGSRDARAEAAEARELELRTLQDLSRALVERGPGSGELRRRSLRLVVSRFGFRDGALFIQPRGDASGLGRARHRERGAGHDRRSRPRAPASSDSR